MYVYEYLYVITLDNFKFKTVLEVVSPPKVRMWNVFN